MRLTVGPLPPAVYWRRRALVLGGILAVALLFYSCGTGSDANPASGHGGKASTPPMVYPGEDSSTDMPPSQDGGPGVPDGGPSGDSAGGSDVDAPTCADADIEVTPKPIRTRTKEGARLRIDLEITNISTRACKRDVGADHQEVRLMRGESRIWSSDDCHPQTGSHVEVLSPRTPIQRFWVTWDGRRSAPKCEGDRTLVREADYHLVARLGKVVSKPVTIEVVKA